MILVSSLIFIQCTSDPIQGPQGTAGIDGVDGTNGVDGVDGTASCVACHSDSHLDPINASYDISGHAKNSVQYNGMALSDYANQSFFYGSCNQCHSAEGYIDFQERGNIQTFDTTTRIDCKTCHSTHETFDFANDGPDYALRTTDAVALMTDPTYVLDFGGTSNMCIDCHQPRTLPPSSSDGTFEITSSHWGPHHGPQATFLEGIQGAMISGTEGYPGVGSAAHRTGANCVQCHMSADDGGDNGMHTWVQTEEGCAGCHSNGIPSDVGGLEADMEALAVLLANVEGVDENGDPVMGIVVDGHPHVGTFTINEAQAAWNYILVEEDASKGVHNPTYAKALIKNSIEVLEK